MKKISIIGLIILIICGCNNTNNTKNLGISCNEKDEMLRNGAYLIDVRTEEEYSESHLENAINIPVDEILDGVIKLNIDQEDVIIVYCKTGHRSITAYNELIKYGYKNVVDFGAMSKCEE